MFYPISSSSCNCNNIHHGMFCFWQLLISILVPRCGDRWRSINFLSRFLILKMDSANLNNHGQPWINQHLAAYINNAYELHVWPPLSVLLSSQLLTSELLIAEWGGRWILPLFQAVTFQYHTLFIRANDKRDHVNLVFICLCHCLSLNTREKKKTRNNFQKKTVIKRCTRFYPLKIRMIYPKEKENLTRKISNERRTIQLEQSGIINNIYKR